MARKKHLINVHTSTGTTAPTGASLYLGEIAVQHTPDNPAIWIKVGSAETSTEYEKFIGRTEIIDLISNAEIILGEGYTYSGIPYVTSATNIADAYSALTQDVIDNEYVTAQALNELNNRINEVSGLTPSVAGLDELCALTLSLSAVLEDDEYIIAQSLNDLDARIIELSGNTGGGSGSTDIGPISAAVISLSAGVKSNEYVTAAALNYLNDRIDEISGNTGGGGGADIQPLSSATYSHVTSTDIHVTAQDKTTWSGKQDAISDLTAIRNGANSGASAYTAVTALSAATTNHVADNGKHLPTVSSSDNGKIMRVTNGSWSLVTPTTVYVGSNTPDNNLGNNGDLYLQT